MALSSVRALLVCVLLSLGCVRDWAWLSDRDRDLEGLPRPLDGLAR